MPDTDSWSGARTPLAAEANDPPADFLRLVQDIRHQLNLQATDLADRNARFSGVPSGTIVSCEALATIWQKTDSGWDTVYENPAAVTTGVATAGTNYTIANQWAKRKNGTLYVRVGLTYTGSTFTVPSNGTFTAATVATLTTDWRPPVDWLATMRSNVAFWSGTIDDSTGAVAFNSGVSGAQLRNADTLTILAAYPAP